MSTRRAGLYARFAVLADHFGLTPAEFGGLTDRQIDRLYFHARNEDGSVRMPPAPPAPATRAGAGGPLAEYRSDLAALDGLLAAHLIPRADHARLVAELKAKHGIE